MFKIKCFYPNQNSYQSLIIFIIFTLFVYSLFLCYVFRIKTPKLCGVIAYLYSVPLKIALSMRSEALSMVPLFSQANFNKRTKSICLFSLTNSGQRIKDGLYRAQTRKAARTRRQRSLKKRHNKIK